MSDGLNTGIDFRSIRPDHGGTRHGGFEEMAVQLFARERKIAFRSVEVIRVEGSGGDGGVEAYAYVPEVGKVGMQAKWFVDEFGDKQFKQIDESVATALANHPDLAEYFVYVPRDRTGKKGAKKPGTPNKNTGKTSTTPNKKNSERKSPKSQREKWDDHVKAWKKLPNGANVKFVWQGQHEMQRLLQEPTYHAVRAYWFGTPSFDQEWMDRAFASACETLGDRYVPELNVPGRIMRAINACAWSPQFEKKLRDVMEQVADACFEFSRQAKEVPCLALVYSQKELDEFDPMLLPSHEARTKWTASQRGDFMVSIGLPRLPGTWWSPLEVLRNELAKVIDPPLPAPGTVTVEEVAVLLQRLSLLLDIVIRGITRIETINEKQKSVIDSRSREFRKLSDSIDESYAFLHEHEFVDAKAMLVWGAAGDGKSHLLAQMVSEARRRKQPAVLILGEQVRASTPPLKQVCDVLWWEHGPHDLLAALDAAGELAGRPALLVIDALNESPDRRIWQSQLNTLTAEVRRYPNVRLIVSCRQDFLSVTLPTAFVDDNDGRFGGHRPSTPEGWATLQHRGLGDVLLRIVQVYIAAFGVRAVHFPPVLREFRNPLFLRTFCQAFQDSAVPEGPVAFSGVVRARVDKVTRKLKQDIRCEPHKVWSALRAVADLLVEAGGAPLDEAAACDAVNAFSPSQDSENSLFTRLKSEGLLFDWNVASFGEEPRCVVRFPFELFSDHFLADALLRGLDDAQSVRSLTVEGGRLDWLRDAREYRLNRGLAEALGRLVPERFGRELIDLLPADLEHRDDMIEDVIDGLTWRSSTSVSASTHLLVDEARERMPPEYFLAYLLPMATMPGHPFNADYLHDLLSGMTLPERDEYWTLSILSLTERSSSVPDDMLNWAVEAPAALVSDEQARLAATALLWFGSSTGCAFRDRAGHAAIRLLSRRADVVEELTEAFDGVNDPYVVERAYAVAAGVAMREPGGNRLKSLATTVYRLMFDTEDVRLHVLLRDAAQMVLETAEEKSSLPSDIDTASFRPPYASRPRPGPSERRLKAIVDDPGWRNIVMSVRPERMGWYGDFGRYTMQSHVHDFARVRLGEERSPNGRLERCDAMRARRWILQRVKSLGWTPERFRQHDDSIHDVSRMGGRETKIERVGKKYQWIALHEYLGYLSDRYQLAEAPDEYRTALEGAWQLDVRNFNPAAEPEPQVEVNDGKVMDFEDHPWQGRRSFLDPWADESLLADREAWGKAVPDDFTDLLAVYPPVPAGEEAEPWLVLEGYWKWKEPKALRRRTGRYDEADTWIYARSWLVADADIDSFSAAITGRSFFGEGIHDISLGDGQIGEYPHGVAHKDVRKRCEEVDHWFWRGDKLPMHIRTACGWNYGDDGRVPGPHLCDLLDLRWSGEGTAFLDVTGNVMTQQVPMEAAKTSRPLVVRQRPLEDALARAGLSIIWGVLGERRTFDYSGPIGNGVWSTYSAVYQLRNGSPTGGLTYGPEFIGEA